VKLPVIVGVDHGSSPSRSLYVFVDGSGSLVPQEAIVHRVNTWDAMREALRDLLAQEAGQAKSCGHEFACICPTLKGTSALAAADKELPNESR